MTLQPGPLSPAMVSLLTAGRSVLLDRKWGPMVLDRFDDSERRAFLTGLLDGQVRLLVPAHMEYIGERSDDGWITAPPGGWGSNPGIECAFDVRWNDGEIWTEQYDEPKLRWENIAALRPVDEAGTGGESGSNRKGDLPTAPVADRWADLERLAKAATGRHWKATGRYVGTAEDGNGYIAECRRFPVNPEPDVSELNSDFIAAADPSTVLELIAAARAQGLIGGLQ